MQSKNLKPKNYRFSCTTQNYNQLYLRYLQQPSKLLELVDYQPHHHLLDLCGGTGAIALAALNLGAHPSSITLLDLNPRCRNTDIEQLQASAPQGLRQLHAKQRSYDRIVCRQAFAYLDIEGQSGDELAERIAAITKTGGQFVFNSFIRPQFKATTYRYQNQRFIELVGYIKRKIFRLQVNLHKGYDFTVSKWHREERIFEIFNPYFDIRTLWSKNAMYWLCTRRS